MLGMGILVEQVTDAIRKEDDRGAIAKPMFGQKKADALLRQWVPGILGALGA